MRPLTLASLATALVLVATPGGATLLVYEPFDYAPGPLAGTPAGGVNLAGSYTGDSHLEATSPGLDYGLLGGAPTATGNRLGRSAGTLEAKVETAIDTDIQIAPGSEIFFSFLVTVNALEDGDHFVNVNFLDDDSGYDITLQERRTTTLPPFHLSSVLVDTRVAFIQSAAPDANEHLVIGRYLNGTELGGDVIQVVGYDLNVPASLPAGFDSDDPAADFAIEVIGGADIGLEQITRLRFTLSGTDNFVDELRIGTTYADVVPEPGTALLLLTGLAGLGLRARSRR